VKICMIGKYPPIEGGVSMNNYWVGHGLAEKGHQVYLVTNADEVEPTYRMYHEKDDLQWYEPYFKETGGFVSLRNSERFSRQRMGHIPVSNPFVTKLASLAADSVRQHDCRIIYSYYFEPYGMAGYLASRWTGVPLIIQHAGSDLERLMKSPDLSTAYREILNAADLVITHRHLVNRFIAIGVKEKKIVHDMIFGLPPKLFNPAAPPMDVSAFLRRASTHISDSLKWRSDSIDTSKPTIGIYGKVGVSKGSFDLVTALSRLKHEGLDFNLLAMTQGTQYEQFRDHILKREMESNTWILPFMPHWKVPRFIRACTAVCFLERDFPIVIHGPTIPREVLACGQCLILSSEIMKKQFYRDQLSDGVNFLLVKDPKNHEELAGVLRYVIENPHEASRIGKEAYRLSVNIEQYQEFINRYEKLFLSCGLSQDEEQEHPRFGAVMKNGAGSLDVAGAYLPCTAKLLSDALEKIASLFDLQKSSYHNNLEKAHGFCEFLIEYLRNYEIKSLPPYFADLFSYESTEIAMLAADGSNSPSFMGCDRLAASEPQDDLFADLKPLKTNYCVVKTYSYDIQGLIKLIVAGGEIPEAVEEVVTPILFVRLPNIKILKLQINQATEELLKLSDGVNTVRSIVTTLSHFNGASSSNDPSRLERQVKVILSQLYQSGVIIYS